MVANEIQTLKASEIRAGQNDRTVFDAEALEELASSIKAHGLAQPPTVRPVDGGFEIVCGERRFRAMTEVLGWAEVPVTVRVMTDEQASAVMLAENVARRDIDPVDEANAYARRLGASRSEEAIRELAASVGVQADRIRRRLGLLELAPEVSRLVARGELGVKVAELLAGLDSDRQIVAVKAYHRERLDLAGMRVVCDELRLAQDQESIFDADSFLRSEVMDEARAARKPKQSDLEALLERALPALEAAGSSAEAAAIRAALGLEGPDGLEGPAAEYVRAELASGPRPAAEVLAGARERGIAERTLRRVKRSLGVRSVRLSDGWAWCLAA